MRFALAGGIALTLSLGLFADTLSLRPGKYEKTSEWAMPGRPARPPKTDSVCLNERDVKDLGGTVTNLREVSCKDSEHKVAGSTTTFTRTCSGSDGSTFEVALMMTVDSPESYRGVATFKKVSGGPMKSLEGATNTTTVKRRGDCTK
jgi:hypothetical protein